MDIEWYIDLNQNTSYIQFAITCAQLILSGFPFLLYKLLHKNKIQTTPSPLKPDYKILAKLILDIHQQDDPLQKQSIKSINSQLPQLQKLPLEFYVNPTFQPIDQELAIPPEQLNPFLQVTLFLGSSNSFSGIMIIEYYLEKAQQIPINYEGEYIYVVRNNGYVLKREQIVLKKYGIVVQGRKGMNRVQIGFGGVYNNFNEGLCKIYQKKDNRYNLDNQLIFAINQPDKTQKIMPCFNPPFPFYNKLLLTTIHPIETLCVSTYKRKSYAYLIDQDNINIDFFFNDFINTSQMQIQDCVMTKYQFLDRTEMSSFGICMGRLQLIKNFHLASLKLMIRFYNNKQSQFREGTIKQLVYQFKDLVEQSLIYLERVMKCRYPQKQISIVIMQNRQTHLFCSNGIIYLSLQKLIKVRREKTLFHLTRNLAKIFQKIQSEAYSSHILNAYLYQIALPISPYFIQKTKFQMYTLHRSIYNQSQSLNFKSSTTLANRLFKKYKMYKVMAMASIHSYQKLKNVKPYFQQPIIDYSYQNNVLMITSNCSFPLPVIEIQDLKGKITIFQYDIMKRKLQLQIEQYPISVKVRSKKDMLLILNKKGKNIADIFYRVESFNLTQQQFWKILFQLLIQNRILNVIMKAAIKKIGKMDKVLKDKFFQYLFKQKSKYCVYFAQQQQIVHNISHLCQINSQFIKSFLPKITTPYLNLHIPPPYNRYYPNNLNRQQCQILVNEFANFNIQHNIHHIDVLQEQIKRISYFGLRCQDKYIQNGGQQVEWLLFKYLGMNGLNNDILKVYLQQLKQVE